MKYQIKIAGVLDQSWSDWLGNVEMASEQLEDGSMVTILMVDANDQSKLFGILDHLRDLNIALIAVSSGENDEKKQEA
jgi:hypothetical protein